jgi:hypothetical protein
MTSEVPGHAAAWATENGMGFDVVLNARPDDRIGTRNKNALPGFSRQGVLN